MCTSLLRIFPSEKEWGSSEHLEEAKKGFRLKGVKQSHVLINLVRDGLNEGEGVRCRVLRTVVNSGETLE